MRTNDSLGKDDVTGEPLVQRQDDTAEVLKKRMEQYISYATPVLEHYRKQNLVVSLDASKSPDDVWTELQNVLQKSKY
jgi:adenylate kinase